MKAGYGDIEVVQRMTARTYIQAIHFEDFRTDFEAAYMDMNKAAK